MCRKTYAATHPDYAWEAIRRMYQQGAAETGSLHPYPCDECYPYRVWHVGHSLVWLRIARQREAERMRQYASSG